MAAPPFSRKGILRHMVETCRFLMTSKKKNPIERVNVEISRALLCRIMTKKHHFLHKNSGLGARLECLDKFAVFIGRVENKNLDDV